MNQNSNYLKRIGKTDQHLCNKMNNGTGEETTITGMDQKKSQQILPSLEE